MDNLIEHLPLNEVVCVHGYLEGYSCRQQDELQSEYFDVAKVSLHITILYRHAVDSIDGKTSTENDPQIIKEHLFVISDDEVQDYHSVHKAQELVKGYLEDQLKIKINKLHEFTDGCAAQYKSRHCIGDLSCCLADYGFNVQRSYFETSHAKVEQDAAGANVKQKVSQAVLRKAAVIRSAKNMKDFLADQAEPSRHSKASGSCIVSKQLQSREGSLFENALVTALTASMVMRRTAATRSGWTTGERSGLRGSHLLLQPGKLLRRLKLHLVTLQSELQILLPKVV